MMSFKGTPFFKDLKIEAPRSSIIFLFFEFPAKVTMMNYEL